VVNVLQRISEQPTSRVADLTPAPAEAALRRQSSAFRHPRIHRLNNHAGWLSVTLERNGAISIPQRPFNRVGLAGEAEASRERSGDTRVSSELGHSALMLTPARPRYVASTKWKKQRYLSMDALLNPAKQEAAA
jgi:hypothetical protein